MVQCKRVSEGNLAGDVAVFAEVDGAGEHRATRHVKVGILDLLVRRQVFPVRACRVAWHVFSRVATGYDFIRAGSAPRHIAGTIFPHYW